MKNSITAALACLGLSGCLGYHIGPAKPYYLRDIHTIAIPTFAVRRMKMWLKLSRSLYSSTFGSK